MNDNNFNEEFNEEMKPAQPPEEKNGNGGTVREKQNDGSMSAERSKLPKQKKIWISVCAVVIAVLFFIAGWFGHYYSLGKYNRTLLWLVDTVRNNYYKELDQDEFYGALYDAALPDQFCAFYTPSEYASVVSESQGNNRDTGLSAITDGDAVRVYRVMGNSPADLAGIERGMYIYRFGGSADTLQTGTRAELYAYAASHTGALCFECGFTEDTKKVYTVTSGDYLASYCTYRDSASSFAFRGTDSLSLKETYNPLEGLDGDTAYISLAEFDGNADWEFTLLLELMNERGRKNLIIDLRYNGGGYLTTLQSISAHLLRNAEGSNPVVATAKYRSGRVTSFNAYGNDFVKYFDESSKVTVLADENTASASECLIGALVDYGTIGYGDIYLHKADENTQARTYGKGVMQSAFVNAMGSAARVTTAEIFWPKGNSIHGTGVTEDDGAHGVLSPLLPTQTDVLLATAIAAIC